MAVLAYAAPSAKRHSASDDDSYLDFVAANNKFPKSTEEFRQRKANFKKSKEIVEELQKKSAEKKAAGKKDPAQFEINWTADLTQEEYMGLLGL